MAKQLVIRPRRQPPNIPCVLGFECEAKRQNKDKSSDDDLDHEFNMKKVIPVVYQFNPSTKTLSPLMTVNKLHEGQFCYSGFKSCAIGKFD